MNVITATGQIWRQKYTSPREGRFPSATAGREDLQGAAVIRYFRGTISRMQEQRYKRIERQI